MSLQAIITPLDKGQITIPIKFRQKLNINRKTVLKLQLKQDGIFIQPLNIDWRQKYIREFSNKEIKEFIKNDNLDKKTLKKIKKYLQ